MYSKQSSNADKAAKFLGICVRQQFHPFDLERSGCTTEEGFVGTIRRVKDWAHGPDGIPHSAHKVCEDLPSKVLVNSVSDLTTEQPSSNFVVFNNQLVRFAPEGVVEPDGTTCTRRVHSLSFWQQFRFYSNS